MAPPAYSYGSHARAPVRSATFFYFLRKPEQQPYISGSYSPRDHGSQRGDVALQLSSKASNAITSSLQLV